MKTNTLLTASSRLLFCCLLCAVFTSCSRHVDRTNMTDVLKQCKGHAIVVAKGVNDGNFEAYKHYLIIRDDSLNCYEYIGADYKLSVGDTLK